ncbi:MAG TPA: ABC transporter substrate-binding protein [Bradyrhizobium sp.]|nr:ABC transporter substrate-binding protein [Bradyrhizobium sp.]
MKRIASLTAMAALVQLSLAAQPAAAEPATLRHGFQAGLPHLPALVMKHEKLLEACLADQGMASTKVEWFELTGSAQTDALLSGNLDFTSGGVTELATLWAATHGKVKAISAESAVPNDLVTTNPKIKTLKDFGPDDRIALPAVKVSPQAIMLQMAAQQTFGDPQHLDALTVAMRPADATVALLTGSSAVNSHFSVPPFQEQEQSDPKVHRVASSYDIMGGPATVVVVTTTARFHDANPQSIKAERCAIERAMKLINGNPKETARIYLDEAHDTKTSPETIQKILEDPRMIYATAPRNLMKFVNFMHTVGQLKSQPDNWKDLFFPEGQSEDGS